MYLVDLFSVYESVPTKQWSVEDLSIGKISKNSTGTFLLLSLVGVYYFYYRGDTVSNQKKNRIVAPKTTLGVRPGEPS